MATVQVRNDEVTVQQAVEHFGEVAIHYQRHTVLTYQGVFRAFAECVGPKTPVSQVTAAGVKLYFYGHHGTGGVRATHAPGTFNLHRAALTSFFETCVEQGWCAASPINKRTIKAERGDPEPKTWLTEQQLVRALETRNHPRDRILVALATNTGLRESEMAAMRISAVNLDKGYIRAKIAKGNKMDSVPITEDLDRELRRWLTYYTAEVGTLHQDECLGALGERTCSGDERELPLCRCWYLVPAKAGPAPLGATNAARVGKLRPTGKMSKPRDALQAALIDVGARVHGGDRRVTIGRGTGSHTFRRSAAMVVFERALENEKSFDFALLVVMKFLHHSNVATTIEYLELDRFRRYRDDLLKGKPFLTMPTPANVYPLGREA